MDKKFPGAVHQTLRGRVKVAIKKFARETRGAPDTEKKEARRVMRSLRFSQIPL